MDINSPNELQCGKIQENNSLSIQNFLSVQKKFLNPSHELKKIFGTRTPNRKRTPNSNKFIPRFHKQTLFVNPKENWPPLGKKGIHMNVVSDFISQNSRSTKDANQIYFVFEHESFYKQVQENFIVAVETMDSNKIIEIVNQHPYHIDSLIQLSEICKMSEDYGMASELIERALYALETCFHPMLISKDEICRLNYKYQENRALFIVLFLHIQNLANRACTRTSLEVAKYLFSLDPENDPLAVILLLDCYAIRAKQYEWLLQIIEKMKNSHNLLELPNMTYSRALALFYTNNFKDADEALSVALLKFPSVLYLLIQELNIQTDSRIASHPYFQASCYSKQRLPLQQLSSLYVCRSKILWSDPMVLKWLEKNTNSVLDKLDGNDPTIKDYLEPKTNLYITTPRPILRHIILSDFKEKVPLAKSLSEADTIFAHDPLPPLDSVNTYKM